ncbi:hypothetical protein [Opitutus sp. ER46]|uniref:hypothetical protein n=1 Tax=Opitutus sp. ER46 TaxID=2161864 RepID=UPI000D316CCB|nr:hypothetical protein [Opitutus sp. ER46]PTX96637.1 hypothetical protein DB354_08240 [Opitutus sp. ER46]
MPSLENSSDIASAQEISHATCRWVGHMADDVGATYGTTPLAVLTATPDELVLSGTRGTFRLPRAHVRKVGRGGFYPWLFAAVRLHHDLPGLPEILQFKSRAARPAEVRAALARLGYPTS